MTVTRSRVHPFVCPVLGLLALLASSSASAQNLRLSDELARPIGGDVRSVLWHPDGDRLLYVADQQVDERFDLYLAGPTPTGPRSIRLNDVVPFADVQTDIRLSPDGAYAVYRGNFLLSNRRDLYSVSLRPLGAPVRLDYALYRNVWEHEVSPDSQRVVYLADYPVVGVLELYSVPIDGSAAPVKLSNSTTAPGVHSFLVSPAGRVVYLAGPNLMPELYSAPLDGSADAVKLNGPLPTGSNQHGVQDDFALTPDGAHAIYRATFGLFVVPVDGSAAPLQLDAGRYAWSFRIDPKGHSVVFYYSDQLYSVPITGGVPSKVNPALVTGGSIKSCEISPNGERVVYLASQDSADVAELYAAKLPGMGVSVKLSEPLPDRGRIGSEFSITADGRRVVYGNHPRDPVKNLYSAPIDGSEAPVRLNLEPPDEGYLYEHVVTPDGRRVVYVSDEEERSGADLFSVPADGDSAPLRLNHVPVRPRGRLTVDSIYPSPDGRAVAYLSDEEGEDKVDLFVAPLDEAESSIRVSALTSIGPVEGDVRSVLMTSDGARAVYLADQETDEVVELFSVATEGRRRPVKLNGPLVAGRSVGVAKISPDDRWVVYTAYQLDYARSDLFAVPADGRGTPVRLNGGAASNAHVRWFAISPDSARVVYSAEPVSGQYEGFSVPIDGSAPPARLDDGYERRISPDSQHVLFLSDANVDGTYDLFRAPIDGRTPAIQLNAPLVAGGNVSNSYEFSSDSQRVVYAARQDAADRAEVYVVPADGSAAPLKISGTMPSGSVVREVEFTADGTRVVYRQELDFFLELYSAPADASAPPVKLNAPVLVGGGVHGWDSPREYRPWQLTPDGSRVVFLSTQADNWVVELFSAPVDGSAAAVRLNQLLPSGTGIVGDRSSGYFRVTPDGNRVVYQQGNQHGGTVEHFSAPVDGSSSAVRLDPGLESYPWQTIQLTADGEQLFFSAHEGTIFSAENDLYAVPVSGATPPERIAERGAGGVSAFRAAGNLGAVFIGDQRTADIFELFFAGLGHPRRGAADPVRSVSR